VCECESVAKEVVNLVVNPLINPAVELHQFAHGGGDFHQSEGEWSGVLAIEVVVVQSEHDESFTRKFLMQECVILRQAKYRGGS